MQQQVIEMMQNMCIKQLSQKQDRTISKQQITPIKIIVAKISMLCLNTPYS